jgi:ferredoxin
MQGEKLFVNSTTAARVLLEGSGLGHFPVNLMEKEKGKGKEKTLSRREIFSSISGEVKRKASSYIASKGKGLAMSPETQVGQRSSPKRRLLRKLLDIKAQKGLKIVKHGPEFPWGKIRINKETCAVCGTCLALCPTGAISKKSENDCQVLYFNSSLCTNCSLCKEACPKNAIDFEVNLPLSDILEDEAKVVARVELIPCTVCGEMITGEKGNLCFTCQKRQVRPMHVSV